MRIIVYGSLRQGQGNSHWMTHAQFLGNYRIAGYELYDLGLYPAVIKGNGEIHGEVYRIDSSILAELDELKNDAQDYKRELVQTPYGPAWMYLYLHSVAGFKRIESGDWVCRESYLRDVT